MTRRGGGRHVSKAPLAAILVLALAAAAGFAWFWTYAHAEARRDPVIKRATFALPDWPVGAAPIRVALISDIHLGNSTMDGPRLARVVASVDALRPDLILIAGDFVAGHKPHEAARVAPILRTELAKLHAPLGVVAVLGNHDLTTGQPDVRAALNAAGITVLQNDAAERGPLAIAGIADGYTRQDRVAQTLARVRPLAGAKIVLTHAPDVAYKLPADSPALFLAGHTHCNQIVLPLISSLHPIFGHRYLCGVYHDRGRTILVTGGLGTSKVPLRFGAPPEEWLLTLGPTAGAASSR